MEIVSAKETYSVLCLDSFGNVVGGNKPSDLDVDQNKGDELEVWKHRDDGFLFVYCNRLEIGYWVNPKLVE